MENTMTPSTKEMTDGQIEKLLDVLRAALKKHRSQFPSDQMQKVLGLKDFDRKLLSPVYECRNLFSFICRSVRVDRTQPPKVLIASLSQAFELSHNVSEKVLDYMPIGIGDEVEVSFFRLELRHSFYADQLEREYELRGLKPVDPYTLVAINKADLKFSQQYCNATQWKSEAGKCWNRLQFAKLTHGGRPVVSVCERDKWEGEGDLWFGGVSR